MLSVTFQGPLIVSPDDLPGLLALAKVPALVAPYVEENGTSEPASPPAEAQKVSRGRPRKSETPPAETVSAPPGDPVNAVPADVPAESVSRGTDSAVATAGAAAGAVAGAVMNVAGDLLTRFTALVDKNYDGALKLLGDFGVGRFSDLKAEAHDAFSKALADMGA